LSASIQLLIQIHQSFDELQVENLEILIKRKFDFFLVSFAAVPSPTNSLTLHMIREENQQNPTISSKSQHHSSSSSSSSEALYNIDDDEDEMDCDNQTQPQKQRALARPPSYQFTRIPYHHHRATTAPYYCNTSPLLAQRLAIPTMTSTYTP